MAALLAGQGVSEVASQYKLDISVVSRWKSSIPDNQLQLLATKKGDRIETLLFEYLVTTLASLKNQAEVVGEREYVIKQPADGLAVLHGVMADKSIRLLEAAERARAAGPQPAPEGNA